MNQQLHQVVILEPLYGGSDIATALVCPCEPRMWPSFDSATQEVTVLHNCQEVKFVVWYMGKALRERILSQVPFATVIFLLYDVTSRYSFAELLWWYKDARQINKTAHLVVVGTTSSRQMLDRVIERAEAEAYAEEIKAKYFEFSIQDQDNMRDVLLPFIAELPLPDSQYPEALEDAPSCLVM